MDVELIQKINNLALDLMKQGLAQDREDAIVQAERLLKRKNGDGYSELREKIAVVESAKQLHGTEESSSQVDLSPDKVKAILEENTKFLVKTIKEFKDKMSSLEKELADLRNKVAYSKLPTVNDIVSSKKTEKHSEEISAEEGPAKISKPQVASHPRVGKYEESDVSIEKFFYMGHK